MTAENIKSLNTIGTWNGNTYTQGGMTFTLNTDGGGNVVSVTTNGQLTGNSAALLLGRVDFEGNVTYLLNGAVSNPAGLRIVIFSIGGDTGNGFSYTPSESDPGRDILMYITDKNHAVSNLTFYPMIRLASDTDPMFAPYSNIRPITGVSSVSVRRTKENLFGGAALVERLTESDINATLDTSKATVTFSGGSVRHSPLIFDNYPFKENTVYTWIVRGYNPQTPAATNIRFKYTDGTTSGVPNISGSADSPSTSVLVSAAGKTVLGVQATFANGTTTLYYNQCGLFEGNISADSFEPYQGQTVTAQLTDGSDPLTVYGGTLDVTTGKLTVTHGRCHIDMNTQASWNTNYNGVLLTLNFLRAEYVAGLCSMFPIRTLRSWTDGRTDYLNVYNGPDTSARMVVLLKLNDISSLQTYQTWIASHEFDYVAPLTTPVTYQLTPAQLATLSGYNAVSTDAGNVTVTYRADIGLCYEELTNVILSLGGNVP